MAIAIGNAAFKVLKAVIELGVLEIMKNASLSTYMSTIEIANHLPTTNPNAAFMLGVMDQGPHHRPEIRSLIPQTNKTQLKVKRPAKKSWGQITTTVNYIEMAEDQSDAKESGKQEDEKDERSSQLETLKKIKGEGNLRLTVTPGQIWELMTQIGVEGDNENGNATSSLESMELWDAQMFEE
ncbi:hypothetical protein Ancab_008960 [Ancistrocladus abbreviatus]